MKFRLRRAVSGIEYEHWLTAHPNVQFHFTPTSASWLNQVQPARGHHLVMARFACDTAWHELIDGGVAMANAMLDARQEGDSYRRVEVITGQRRRRRWTGEEKARIVRRALRRVRTSLRWRGAMASPAGCSRYGEARLRRRWPARRRASCASHWLLTEENQA